MPREAVLHLPPGRSPGSLDAAAWRWEFARRLELKPAEVRAVRVKRISFDARPRHMAWRVAAEVWVGAEEPPEQRAPVPPEIEPPAPDAPRAVVVGSGPAGMFCALDLLRAGVRVTLLERGKPVQERRRDVAALNRGEAADPDSNYCFGEGGAGTFSDGKLYSRSAPAEEARALLELLVAHGAPEEILVSWRPHVGSNRLPRVVEALRGTLVRGGAQLRFGTRAAEILTRGGRAAGVRTPEGECIESGAVVLATGHSALDALQMAAAAGAPLEPKGFAMGVRVEHPQAWLDAIQYHGTPTGAGLPPAFYELATQARGRGVYSFCMCPGGWVVPSQTGAGQLVVNGMSLARRDSPFANSGVVVALEPQDWCGGRGGRWGWTGLLHAAAAVSLHPLLHERDPGRLPERPEEDPFFGVRLQLALEAVAARAGGGCNRAPAQSCDHFVAADGRTAPPRPSSYRPGLTAADFGRLLPPGLASRLREAMLDFDRKLPGFAGAEGQLIGVETRTSSPVRVLRDEESLQSPRVPGLFPCGEGAGYAGGIVSAALDGRRVARAAAAYLGPVRRS